MTARAIKTGAPCPVCKERVLAVFYAGRGGSRNVKVEIHHYRDAKLWREKKKPKLCRLTLENFL